MDFSQSYWHLVIFAILFFAGLVLVVWQAGEKASSLALANNVIQEMGAVVVVSAGVAILSVDGAKMFAESFLEKRYRDGLKEGVKEGMKEGMKEGERRLLDTLVSKQVISDEQRKQIESERKEK